MDEAVQKLWDRVQEGGWTVDITDHFALSDSREGARVEPHPDGSLLVRPRRPWGSQGRAFHTMRLTSDGDLTAEGNVLRAHRTPTAITSRTTPGVRQIYKTYWFHPPRP